MSPTDGLEAYGALVAKRKQCRLCARCLENPSVIDGGLFDSEQIGPYTQWQGNLHSPLVVVGQDFGDLATFRKYKGWPGWDVETNEKWLVPMFHPSPLGVAQRPMSKMRTDWRVIRPLIEMPPGPPAAAA